MLRIKRCGKIGCGLMPLVHYSRYDDAIWIECNHNGDGEEFSTFDNYQPYSENGKAAAVEDWNKIFGKRKIKRDKFNRIISLDGIFLGA